MKTTFTIIATVAALVFSLGAANALAKDKVVKVKGEAKCAMCMLHESSTCQTVIQSEKDGKTQNYYVVDNAVSKAFHENVCKSAKKVVAKGTVAEVGGKKELTLTKIELAKK